MAKNAKVVTYQAEFPLNIMCHKCRDKAAILMMIIDDDGEVCEQPRPVRARVWPHDCVAIALYLCTSCGKITAEWNQA